MLKVFILVFTTAQGEGIEIAAFESRADCEEVAFYLNTDLRRPAVAHCE